MLRPHQNVSRTHWWRRWRLCQGSLLWCWLPGLLPAPLQQGHWQAGGPPLLHWPVTPSSTSWSSVRNGEENSGCNSILPPDGWGLWTRGLTLSTSLPATPSSTSWSSQCSQWWGKFRMELNNSPRCPDWRRSTARSGPLAGRGWIGGLFAGIFFFWTDCGYFSIFWIYE